MTRPSLKPICLIGPPAAGKTTLALALSDALGVPIVRPRDLVRVAVSRYPATAELFHRDERGRVPDESLGFALRVTLDGLHGMVILENLPWDVVQLADLYRVAGKSVQILSLDGPDELLLRRRTERRYCAICYPLPAQADVGGQCRRCGTVLTIRADDILDAFNERLSLHRQNAAKILALAPKLRVYVVPLEADQSPEELAERARRELEDSAYG